MFFPCWNLEQASVPGNAAAGTRVFVSSNLDEAAERCFA
jgi:hypothetical protein